MSFNFGAKPVATGFTLPTNPVTTATTAIGGGFQFASGDNKLQNLQNKPSSGLFTPSSTSLPTTLPKSSAPASTPTLNFNTAVSSAPSLLLGSTGTTSGSSSAVPQYSFGTTTASTTSSFIPVVGLATTTPPTGIALSLASTTSSTEPPKLPAVSLGPATSSVVAATSVTSTTSSIPATGSLTFAQLEDSINKWTIDLEEQGKFFINQARQLNAWDTLLISNGEKILNLNSSIERVKQQQQQLDQELDFVLAQQKELEELIVPLEKELVDIPVTDIDRNQMYQFSEILDSQLKQMSDDLKEIIEHINESNKDEEVSNPVTQIGRILNAHMNSLQWIDRNTAQISSHLEQITKMQDSNRRNFSLNHTMNSINM